MSGIPGMTPAMLLGLIFYLYTDHVQIAPHLVVRRGTLGLHLGLEHLAFVCFRQAGVGQGQEQASRFGNDMAELLQDEDYGDVEFFLTSGKRVAAGHKAILVQRCPYFERLFEGGFRESGNLAQGEVQRVNLLQDIEDSVFKDFLRYLYTGDKRIFTSENVVPLLRAADAFLVDDILQDCVALIEESIDIGNACAVLSLGNAHSSLLLAVNSNTDRT